MPREVKAWACSYGCRRMVNTKRKEVEKHEKTCACNPARRACKTCRFNLRKGPDLGCVEEHLKDGRTMAVDCEYWEALP